MGRVYMSYINDGQHGYTWLTLVALTMGAHGNKQQTVSDITRIIWGKSELPPIRLRQQVNACIDKLVSLKYATYQQYKIKDAHNYTRSIYHYWLTPEGIKHFEPPSPGFDPSTNSDSKIFHPAGKQSKKVIKFHRRRRKVAA